MIKYIATAVLLLLTVSTFAQRQQKTFTFEGYGEMYYGFDFGSPRSNNRPRFVYSHNRHNEVNVNLAMLRAQYRKDRVRANVGIMAGTYANANLAAEPGVARNIYEANAGIKITKKRELWFDAGVFESHIGPEGAISMDCPTLTRSLTAEGSPYYEAGMRLSYTTINQKWYIALLHLNGWQRIYRPNNSYMPGGGLQLMYKPTDKLTLNLSTYVGAPSNGTNKARYFADFYAIAQLSKRISISYTLDAGLQENAANDLEEWMGTSLIFTVKPSRQSAITARGEYFNDPYLNIMPANANVPINGGYYLWAYSLGYDRWVTKNILWRVEAKGYANANPLFRRRDSAAGYNDNYVVTGSLAFRFKK